MQMTWPQLVERGAEDRTFVERLREATYLEDGYTDWKFGNAHEPDQWDQTRLQELNADPQIKGFLGNRELRRYVRSLSIEDTRRLPAYLALARVTSEGLAS